MQRLLAISLSLLLFISTVGITVNKHYCGSKLQSISVELLSHNDCCCGTMEKMSNCCKDERVLAQLGEDQLLPSQPTKLNNFQTLLQTIESGPIHFDLRKAEPIIVNNSPPPEEELYLIYSSLTYYG